MNTDDTQNVYPLTEEDYHMRMLQAQESQARSLATIARYLQVYAHLQNKE